MDYQQAEPCSALQPAQTRLLMADLDSLGVGIWGEGTHCDAVSLVSVLSDSFPCHPMASYA